MQTNPARGTTSETTTAGTVRCESCSRPILAALNFTLCRTCYRVATVCRAEAVADLFALERRAEPAMLASIVRAVRAADLPHGDALIAEAEKRF